MSDLEAAVTIAADPAAVWQVLADVSRLPDWLTVHDGFDAAPPRLREGAELAERVSSGPVAARVEWTLEAVQAPHRLEWHGVATGGATVHATYRLRPAGTGTEVTCAVDWTLPAGPLGALAARVARPRGTAEAAASLERLRALVEDPG